jgi:DMSO reductase anchor subunit
MPVRYERDEQGNGGDYTTKVDKDGRARQWGFNQLSTRENPLVFFTLVTQAVVGAYLALFFGSQFGIALINPESNPVAWPVMIFSLIGLQTIALVLSTLHLGRPHRFYRAFNNLKYSPVSREVAGVAVFYNLLGIYGVLTGLPVLTSWLSSGTVSILIAFSGWGAAISGVLSLYFMQRIYRIKARPFWNHWQVLTSFYGNMLTLGALLAGVVSSWIFYSQHLTASPWAGLGSVTVIGLLMEMAGLWFHARSMKRSGGEAEAAHYLQTTDFYYAYVSRNALLIISAVSSLALILFPPGMLTETILWSMVGAVVVVTTMVGRGLFYALVIPTTMPGAFFWKNPGFQQHARDTGLAKMSQVGVLADCH